MSFVTTGLATPDEREASYRLAYEIFCEEMGTLRDVADHDRRLVKDEAIERAHVICASIDGEVVGSLGILLGEDGGFPEHFERGFDVARFLPVVSREHMAITIRFLVKERYRGSRVPFRLISEAARFQAARGVRLSFCDCQPHLVPLYTSLGFRSYAPLFDQPGFGVMVPLLMIVVDLAHMREIRSPILPSFPPETAMPGVAAEIAALIPQERPAQSAQELAEEDWSEVHGLLSRSRGQANAFEGLSQEDRDALLQQSHVLSCSRGQQLVVEGQGTRTVYVMLEGTAEVHKNGQVVSTLSPGEIFGEFALLLESKRSADVFAASEHVRVIALSERTLRGMMTSRPELAAKFLWNLSRSLALRITARER